MMMCSRCKKNPAVIFISTMTGTERRNKGLCLSCAKELGLPNVNDYLQQMGITDDMDLNEYNNIFSADPVGDDPDDNNDETENETDESDIIDDFDPFGFSRKEEDNHFERGGAGTMPIRKNQAMTLNPKKNPAKSPKNRIRSASALNHTARISPDVQRRAR